MSRKCLYQICGFSFSQYIFAEFVQHIVSDSCTILKIPCNQCSSLCDDQISNALCTNIDSNPLNTYKNYFHVLTSMLYTPDTHLVLVMLQWGMHFCHVARHSLHI